MPLRRNFHIFFATVFLKNVKYRCKLREITLSLFYISGLSCDVIQSTTLASAKEIHRVSVDSPCLSPDNESEQSFILEDVACIHNSEV